MVLQCRAVRAPQSSSAVALSSQSGVVPQPCSTVPRRRSVRGASAVFESGVEHAGAALADRADAGE
jgi:hypothetical protein